MADDEAVPSNPKKKRQAQKKIHQIPLSGAALERLLYESDEDVGEVDLDIFDSDEEYSPGEEEVTSGDDVQEEEEANEDLRPPQRAAFVSQVPTPPIVPPPIIQWGERSSISRGNFTKSRQYLVLPDGDAPIDYFNLLIDDNFYKIICEETNAYAEEIFLTQDISEFSRITRWRDVTPEELRIFFGVLLHMGTISTPRLQDYWKTSRLFSMHFFRDAMSRDRFLLIMRCLHFARNPKEGEAKPADRLFKIRPLIDYFNNKIQQIYYPDKELSLDESMVLFRGRLSFRQYIKNKRHKYGIKLYMLTEPDGMILKFVVYTGQLDDFGGKGHAANVVLHLMEERLDVGHSIYMNNYYNSYDLAVKLLRRQTYCTGTLLTNRKNTPNEVKSAKLKKGEDVAKYSTDGVLIGKWRDKWDVAYITTEFTNEMVTYQNKLNRKKEKPRPIFEYNKYMGGVDRQDQLLAYYPCERKCLRWYKKLGIHLFQLLLLDSFLLYKRTKKSKISLYDFRLQIIENLVPPKTPPVLDPRVKEHTPKKNPLGPKGKGSISRRCTYCYNEFKKRKDTSYHCQACVSKPYLCVGECFVNYHKKL